MGPIGDIVDALNTWVDLLGDVAKYEKGICCHISPNIHFQSGPIVSLAVHHNKGVE